MCKNLPQLHPVTIHYKQPNVLYGDGQMKWRWFQQRMHLFLWLRELSHFPSSMLRHYLQITDNTWWGNFSINFCTLRLCYRRWDVWVSRKWSGKIFSPLSDGVHCVSCGGLSVSQITAWPLVQRWSISLELSGGYWMMWNLIPWWEIEAWVKMNLSIFLVIIDWQGPITLSACILWL